MGCQYTPYYPKKCFKIQKKLQFWEFIRVCHGGQKMIIQFWKKKQFKVGIISEVDRLQKREGNLFALILYFSAHKSIRY